MCAARIDAAPCISGVGSSLPSEISVKASSASSSLIVEVGSVGQTSNLLSPTARHSGSQKGSKIDHKSRFPSCRVQAPAIRRHSLALSPLYTSIISPSDSMQQLGALYPCHQAGAIVNSRIECVDSSIRVASRDEPDSQLCILLARQVGLISSLRDQKTPTSLTGAIFSPSWDGAVLSAAQNSRECSGCPLSPPCCPC